MQRVSRYRTCCHGPQGIGPATASAVLAAHCPDLPFMSDEAMAAALPGGKEYTVGKYLQLVAALRKKAASLGDCGAHAGPVFVQSGTTL